jgi:hypothetical protein
MFSRKEDHPIVLDGLRDAVAPRMLYRREGIAEKDLDHDDFRQT